MLTPKIFLLSGLHNCALNNKSNSACYNSATHHYVAIKLSGKRQVPYNRLWSVTVGCRCQNGNRADICLIDNHKKRHYKYINEHTSISQKVCLNAQLDGSLPKFSKSSLRCDDLLKKSLFFSFYPYLFTVICGSRNVDRRDHSGCLEHVSSCNEIPEIY